LIHSSPDSQEPIKHSLIKIMTYQNDTYLRQINDKEFSDISFDEDDDEEIKKKNGLNKTKHNKGEKELLYFLYIYKL
jgi:hypothetical protein